LVTKDDGTSTFLDRRRKMFSLANTHSLIDVIELGESLTNENIDEHATYFKNTLVVWSKDYLTVIRLIVFYLIR
jgi:hypothetical protein